MWGFGCMRTKDRPERIPDYQDFLDHFENALRSLCVDYAFLEEFLSRSDLLGLTDPNETQRAVSNVFWTYRNSLYLETAKLVDGVEAALSLENFIKHHSSAPRWAEPYYCKPFRKWKKALQDWKAKNGRATLSVYRDEHLAHTLAKGAGRKRNKLRAYKGFEGNSVGRYLVTEGEMLQTCKEGIVLLAWLLKLCGHGRNNAVHFGFRRAAEKDVELEIEKCRRYHGALLDLL